MSVLKKQKGFLSINADILFLNLALTIWFLKKLTTLFKFPTMKNEKWLSSFTLLKYKNYLQYL